MTPKLLLILLLFALPLAAQRMPFRKGSSSPSSAACSAATAGDFYLQTGDPSSTPTQLWSCVQTGPSAYAWHPSSHKIGSSPPAACVVGQLFFDTDAPAGQNLYACTSTGVWTLQSGGGGASSVSDLTDFLVTRVDADTLSINGGTVVVGNKRFTIASDSSCDLTAVAADTLYLYLLNGTFVTGFSSTGSTFSGTCSGWTLDNNGITDFPPGSVPLWKWTATTTPGQWDADGGTDYRAIFSRTKLVAGQGVTVTPSATTGMDEVAVDTATTPQFTSGTSAPSGSCTVGQRYHRTDTNQSWDCTSTNTWTEVTGGGSGVTAGTPAAKCQNGAAAASANLPATNAPTPNCYTGTNTLFGYLTWPDADGDYYIQDSFIVTTTSLNFALKWRTSATTGDVVWQLQTACIGDGETSDPSFNAAQTVVDTAKATALQENDAAITGVTTTGCSAGERLIWKLFRNRTHASDTVAAEVDLISYRWY